MGRHRTTITSTPKQPRNLWQSDGSSTYKEPLQFTVPPPSTPSNQPYHPRISFIERVLSPIFRLRTADVPRAVTPSLRPARQVLSPPPSRPSPQSVSNTRIRRFLYIFKRHDSQASSSIPQCERQNTTTVSLSSPTTRVSASTSASTYRVVPYSGPQRALTASPAVSRKISSLNRLCKSCRLTTWQCANANNFSGTKYASIPHIEIEIERADEQRVRAYFKDQKKAKTKTKSKLNTSLRLEQSEEKLIAMYLISRTGCMTDGMVEVQVGCAARPHAHGTIPMVHMCAGKRAEIAYNLLDQARLVRIGEKTTALMANKTQDFICRWMTDKIPYFSSSGLIFLQHEVVSILDFKKTQSDNRYIIAWNGLRSSITARTNRSAERKV
ncbi:hypothetical protein K505DRAFT_414781 [Melanomma pulvis-pyrius CBS 109.77]|uniref:Uncharacterized protein n=1 Tax=Melanomma pulvis-pyrius CBS 109.77 TaxID=1314802 RepID=A0A6A6XMU3_9PLEO|nr:hypothetical protein K505DRAFT_414781 [Melanomma pulvis-pyrius CBS 109.77]